jgi:hypothetical protein
MSAPDWYANYLQELRAEATETEWLDAKKPYPPERLAKLFGSMRKVRLLMVGLLEPLRDLFSDGARSVFLTLREWAEDDRRSLEKQPSWYQPGGPLQDYMQRTVAGVASGAVSWIVSFGGTEIRTDGTFFEVGRPGDELALKAAEAVVLKKVGGMPPGAASPRHPWHQTWQGEFQIVQARQADLMRCVYGNPYRSVASDAAWLTSSVVPLAQGIYDDRAFDRLPILADALEDAGCTNADILSHCRKPGEHARGCWVVDLLLGKE